MMRKAIRGHLETNPDLERLLPHIKQNVGFVFTNMELLHVSNPASSATPALSYSFYSFLLQVRDLLLANKVKAPAKAGALAPVDVVVPAQNTGMGPEKTSFFQALAIPTKITKGTIEIIKDVDLIKFGDRVGMSEATLLQMLKIYPFSYGLVISKVYDSGSVFDPEILDITDAQLLGKFAAGVRNVAAVCLTINYPTVASVPHSVVNGMKNLLAIAAATEITFKEAEMVKKFLADPSAFASAAPAAAPAAAAAAPKKAEAKKEESEEEDDDMGFGLFD